MTKNDEAHGEPRHDALLLALIVGVAVYSASMLLPFPLLHFMPMQGEWTLHPPEGAVTMKYYGALLNAMVVFLLACFWGKRDARLPRALRPHARRLSVPVVCAFMTLYAISEIHGATTVSDNAIVPPASTHGAQEPAHLMSKSISVGDSMPSFQAQDATGKTISSASLMGKGPLVIYFYPRDETTGCTIQAKNFRDNYDEFTAAGAEIIGVSSDSCESHRAFAANHELPFILLSDKDKQLRRTFGVSRTLGLLPGRVTYIVDAEGVVRHIFDSQFQVDRHVHEALRMVRLLARAQKTAAGTE